MNQYKEYAKMFKIQPDLVTVKHMSEMLGVSTKQIYKLIHNGKINAFLCGNTYSMSSNLSFCKAHNMRADFPC